MGRMIGIDQRVFYRLASELPVRFCVLSAAGESPSHDGAVLNLSSGGMLLRAQEFEPQVVEELLLEHSFLAIELVLPDLPGTLLLKAQLFGGTFGNITSLFQEIR